MFGDPEYLFRNENCASDLAAILDEFDNMIPGGRVGVACFLVCRNVKSRDGTSSTLVGSGTIFPPHASHSYRTVGQRVCERDNNVAFTQDAHQTPTIQHLR